ncbi:LytTR family DNA-binding domain-containing protein [uncultured Hoeflea sp.]|uniref:LytTR family DNA-binding domain-containing protein n=1 Tax=uncultured Hoeflea sp. TaxID=538666 RepID=UPI002610E958|nr:LytTR family DNA-binding domain-containing protein [uncultured Hoeflea sp.]
MAKVANNSIVSEVLSEARELAGQRRFWLTLVTAGLVIGLTGPFGTYDTLPVVVRIGYWLAVVCLTYWLGYLVSFAVASLAEDRGMDPRLSLAIGALVAALPVTAGLAGLHMLVLDVPFWADAKRLLPYVAIITLTLAALSEGLANSGAHPATLTKAKLAGAAPDSAWLDELPAHLGRELILLQAQDHYVRARTDRGETLIRTTLQDAARDLGDYGVRVHRSWWVARHAIRGFRYRAGMPVVVLHDGLELPVGRSYRRALRQALEP